LHGKQDLASEETQDWFFLLSIDPNWQTDTITLKATNNNIV